MTRFEMCDAILACFRLNGLVPAYAMWLQAVEDDLVDHLDLEVHARGNRIDEQAAMEIRDFDGMRRIFGKHGWTIKDPREVDELMSKIRNVSNSPRHGMPAAPKPLPDKEDDRALAMLHAFSGVGSWRKP